MAQSMSEARQCFEQLTIGSQETAMHHGRNLTIQTPDKNVTLVLNFSNGISGQPLPARKTFSMEGQSLSASLMPVSSHRPPRLAHQVSVDSLQSPESKSSPSDSPASSTPSTPDMCRHATRSVGARQTDSETDSSNSTRMSAPSRQTIDKFLNSQGQFHTTVSLSEINQSDVYSENWVRKKHYLSFVKHHRIRDVKFDGDCNIILTSRHSVQLYDANGHFIERLFLDKVKEPWGIHVHDNGNIFVSDHKNDCVKEFTHIGIQMKKYGPVPSPCGVAVSSSNYVFVCSRADGCVYVFDKNNKLVRKIGEGTLTSPAYVILHGKLMLVSDEARIIGFTTDNTIAFVYGQSESINHPACLTIDRKTGFALATAYYKSSIIAVKRDMNRALMVKDVTRPILCALSPYGHLLVGERLSKGVHFKMYRAGNDA